MASEAIKQEVERQLAVMRDDAVQLYGEDELRERLAGAVRDDRPLRIKFGMDPSAPDLHLGHTVNLLKLARLQELGHKVIVLIGDFTAMIGDPSGRKKSRPVLDAEQVKASAATYVDQVKGVIDVEAAEVRFNSEWMDAFSPSDFIRLCARGTVARLLERDDFAKRYGAGEPIFVHELFYPFVQGYDSVALEADIELGGTDQTFNMLMARELQRDYGQKPQAVITHGLLVGTDGHEKMSKSVGNSIGIVEAPEQMYAKIMSLPDAVMEEYASLLSMGEWPELIERCRDALAGRADPMASKQLLAQRVVARHHGLEASAFAADHFGKVVQRKELPDDIPECTLETGAAADLSLLEVLEGASLIGSRSEGRRLTSQGGVQVDGTRVEDPTRRLAPGSYLVQVGKRRFVRVRID